MIPKFRYPAAIIIWNDSHARNQAVEYEESEVAALHRPEECMILGLIIKDDSTGISLYSEETGDTSVRGLSFIPREMLKQVTYVNLSPIRSKKTVQRRSPSPTVDSSSPHSTQPEN